MTAAVSTAVSIPVIASGGAGGLDDFVDVFTDGARTPRSPRRSFTTPRPASHAQAAPATTRHSGTPVTNRPRKHEITKQLLVRALCSMFSCFRVFEANVHADSIHRPPGRRRRAARAGRAARDSRRGRVPMGAAVRAFPEGAGDRSRRGDGHRRQPGDRPADRAARSRAASAAAFGRVERAQEILAAGAQQIIAGSSLFKDGQPDLEFAKAPRRRGRPRSG